MTRNTIAKLFDFTGGLNNQSPAMVINNNEASDLQNINILPTGGFQKRNGNSTFNSTAMDVGATVQGLGYFRPSITTDYLMAIAGTKIYKSDNLDGTMDDITGSVAITLGKNNIWTHEQMNNLSIFVGGYPDAPIKWSGTGNAAVLGGSPPSGEFCLMANNRLFIGNTATNPSRIYWSTLGNPEDWSGTGSGSQDVKLNDGDTLVGAVVTGLDTMLLFKQNSIHLLNINSSPFPLYPLLPDTGAISKNAIVNVDGIVYFITPEPRMKATDGTRVLTFPESIDNVWDGLNKTRLKYIQGIYNKRLRQIWWLVSDGSSDQNDLCIIWDLDRKCWLRNPTGYKMNCIVKTGDRTCYGGAYNGKIYKLDDSGATEDASESVTTINSFWRSGWMTFINTIENATPNYANLNFVASSNVDFTYSYGFDFDKDMVSEYISATGGGRWGIDQWGNFPWGGGDSNAARFILMKGSGNYFQVFIQHNTSGQQFTFNGIEFGINKNQVKYT